jgi:hypothetical protein
LISLCKARQGKRTWKAITNRAAADLNSSNHRQEPAARGTYPGENNNPGRRTELTNKTLVLSVALRHRETATDNLRCFLMPAGDYTL